MHTPQQPTARHAMLNVINAFPSRLGAGTIGGPQNDARDYLRGESEYQRATPDIAPPRPAGHVLIERMIHQFPIPGAVIEPFQKAAHQAGFLSAIPVWNFSKATQI